jgi:hypothetical protein
MIGRRLQHDAGAGLRRQRLGALAVCLVVGCVGCGSSAGPVTPVQGTVAYRGARLHSGTIVFTPDSTKGSRGQMALGEIQPDGSYQLRTGETAGAVAGWHRITVVAVQPPGPASPGLPFPIPYSLVPEKYRDPDLCGLAREVKAGQNNVFDLDLE